MRELLIFLAIVCSFGFAVFLAKSFFDASRYHLDESKYPSAWQRFHKCSCGAQWTESEWARNSVCSICGEDLLRCKKISCRTVIRDGKLALEEKET